MLSQRRAKITELIEKNGEVLLTELEALFPDVSSMTLRRDLERLEKEGIVIRIKGGAKSIAHLTKFKEATYKSRIGEQTEAKKIIAEKAVEFLEPSRSFFFDSGTTIMNLAKIMPQKPYSIVTAAPSTALIALENENANVILLGGRVDRDNLSASGSMALGFIKKINIDIAFLAASGFSLETGFTCGSLEEAELKEYVVSKAKKVIMLMDSAKLNCSMPYTFASLSDVNCLVSETAMPEKIVKEAEKFNVICK